jgi:hypothetical protein
VSVSYTQVNTRAHTQPGIRGASRLAPYGITLFLGLNDPRASCVRAPHTPAVYPIGIQRAGAYSTADGRLIRQYTPAASYVSHMSHIVALF